MTPQPHIGIGKATLARRTRAKWGLVFHARWIMGRGSRDGKVRLCGWRKPRRNTGTRVVVVAGELLPAGSLVRIDLETGEARLAGYRSEALALALHLVETGRLGEEPWAPDTWVDR